MGFFSRSEFDQGSQIWKQLASVYCVLPISLSTHCRSGLRLLSAHDVPSLKASLNQVAIKVDNDPDVFQSFYQFAFKFCLTVSAVASLQWCQWLKVALPALILKICQTQTG